ncbi:hypothetical protein FS749_000616 [Ceratobasidium sp. UAMH 11750]|nr:hypothetical protein FS749_000616 [Ceratobasidium sp. UAMH 11750]
MTRGDGSGDSLGFGSRTSLNPSGETAKTPESDGDQDLVVFDRETNIHVRPTPDLPASHSSSYTRRTLHDNTYPSPSQYSQVQLDPSFRTTRKGSQPLRSVSPPSYVYAPPLIPPRPPSP